jgi:formylglycine-generating enzyme required for sulfatase activity
MLLRRPKKKRPPPLAELGALVESLAALAQSNPGCGARQAMDEVLDAQLRTLDAADVEKHFRYVQGREKEQRPLWCRIPPEREPQMFLMGSPRDEGGRDDDEDQVWVTLPSVFGLAATTVTLGQYELMAGKHPAAARPQSATRLSRAEAVFLAAPSQD